jgi:YHS domain-containing protein
MSLFGRLFASFFETEEAGDVKVKPAEELGRALHEIRHRAEAASFESPPKTSREKSAERTAELHGQARERLLADILERHAQLATGLEEASLRRLQMIVTGHQVPPEDAQDPDLWQRIEHSVLHYLFAGCAELAFRDLESRMARAGLSWPVPDSLKLHRDEASLESAMGQRVQSLADDFRQAPMGAQADLAVGEVEVWRAVYPLPGSWLWEQTVLQAVGAGLQLRRFVELLERWLWRDEKVEEELQQEVEKALAQARELLGRGVFSLVDADRLASKVRQVVRQTIPGLVWQHLEGGDDRATVPTTLGSVPGLAESIDPVCGMALSPDRIVARRTLDGQSYDFCSDHCFQRFHSDPGKYVRLGSVTSARGL